MNLIAGSTGTLGMETCRQLRALNRPTRALVRPTADFSKRGELDRLGCELVNGDLKDGASLRAACAGVDTVIATASSTFSRQNGDSIESVDHAGYLRLIEAAQDAGVRRFVFVTYRTKPQFPCPLSDAKLSTERALQASGLEYVILRASYFMEIWLSPMLGFDPLGGKVRIFGDGRSRLSWVSFRDVARVAAAAAGQVRTRNVVLDVGGPEALSPREIVRMFEAAGAAEIVSEYVLRDALQAQYDSATDPLQKSFAALMLGYADGDAMDITAMMSLFPLRLTSVRDYVSTLLAQRQAASASAS